MSPSLLDVAQPTVALDRAAAVHRTRLSVLLVPSEPAPPGPILGEALFKDAFVREWKRADRFDTPFAVLLVERSPADAETVAWPSVLRALESVKRDVDAVGWFEEDAVLGLLLPEMSRKGGLKAVKRLRRQLARRLSRPELAVLSSRLYARGPVVEPETERIPDVELIAEAIAQQSGHPWRDAAKRALDVAGSIALLLLFGPVLLAVVAAVKWSSPGPAIFRQTRVGQRGQPFEMLKFRSMHVNVGDGIHQDYMTWFIRTSGRQARSGNEFYKLTNDPRITSIGRFLRRTSLDELPQFWNVLRGEMSLVGPRPALPREVELYQPWHRRRVLDAKPGITGLWQVNGRSRTTFDEMVRLDLRYARTRTLWTDIKILAATPRAMLGKGAC